MKFLGNRRMPIAIMKLPSDIKQRMKEPRVAELAASIAALGGQPAEPPIVEKGTRDLKVGRDRIAACMLLKIPRVDVRIATGTPEEFARLELDENLRRRQDDRKKMLAEAVKLEEAAIKEKAEEAKATAKEHGTPVPPQDAKSPKKQAREAVAAKAKIKPESVRKAEQRQKAKEAPPKPEPPPIDCLGLEPSKALLAVCQRIKDLCGDMEASSRYLQAEINKTAGVLPGGVTHRLMEAVKTVGAEARAVKPHSLCPKCKGAGDEKCSLCKGAHYAREEQMKDVPKEWLAKATNGAQAQA